MHPISPDMQHLFAQLGESTDLGEIDRFIQRNVLPTNITALHEAVCWTHAQSDFLREAIEEDSDWAPVVDQLNARFHSHMHGA